jgi:hypothetical protein
MLALPPVDAEASNEQVKPEQLAVNEALGGVQSRGRSSSRLCSTWALVLLASVTTFCVALVTIMCAAAWG